MSALADRQAVVFRPGPDVTAALAACRGVPRASPAQIMRGPMSQQRPMRRYVVGGGTTAGVGMGLSKDGLERFAAVAASHVGEDKVPGLAALVAHGGDVHVEALGTLTVGGRPVERASLFRIASTTKPITAAATLALVREGLLELDEPACVVRLDPFSAVRVPGTHLDDRVTHGIALPPER